ncbi:PREDICTED: ABC transporter G family member 11-like isoform X2 [Lupinus angustifolius]|uniref:ABC transporter G family member 11-like isoform X2 n=1 Tax=Lupinus angustifolius TaxID=3871 RepID=UPI00092FB690|nr:PREDICTED: ABC transporter G family member 11-like isoform X2 [Lupinus angustifolius]
MASIHPSIPLRPTVYGTKPTSRSVIQQSVIEIETTSLEIEPSVRSTQTKEMGICLTWKDLYVTASVGRNGRRPILQGLTGYAKPGQLLAIMGPSGCGKSTLLDALAGRLGSNTRQTGEILINGHKQALAYGTSAYVTQDDTLLTSLTVREAVHYSAQLQLPASMSKGEKKERADFIIREMGLQETINTRIGGWGCKGISGGQKRRVSICIEILTQPKLLFLDEPTSGLDSAASYYVMRSIATLQKKDNIQRTVIASIHQPSTEVFQLFSNLCLLSSGTVVYFGPASAASEFFTSSGFPCPPLQNPSDHLLKVINKDFDQGTDLDMNGTITIPAEEAIRILVESYKLSERNHEVQKEVVILSEKDRGSLLSFVSTFITFMAIGGFPSFVEDMKVFERERLNGHYGVTAFVIGNTFSSIPYLVLNSLIPGAITYYPPGLQKGYEHFLYFICVLFSCLMLVESLMMIIASIVPNYLMGIITGAGIQGLMILVGGFFKLPNELPKSFWRYPIHYVAFHRYAFQGLFKNEYEGLKFNAGKVGGGLNKNISGEEVLRDTWEVDMSYSKWVDLAILLGMIVLYRVIFLVILKTTEKVKFIMACNVKST